MRKIAFKLITFFFALVSLEVFANTSQYVEFSGTSGRVNWSTASIEADGFGVAPENKNAKVGSLLACRAAVVEAQRNLLEVVQGVRVNSTTIINNYMLKSDEVKSTVEGVVKSAAVIAREPHSDGSCQVTVSAPLGGTASKTVYAQVLSDENVTSFNWSLFKLPFFPQAHAQSSEVDVTWQDDIRRIADRVATLEKKIEGTRPLAIDSAGPTGLIVDARGSNFIPSMNPKVRRLRGEVVYPTKEATRAYMNQGRLVSLFAKDVEFAMNHPVVGSRPIVVKALRTWGDTRTEIVLTSEYADRVRKLEEVGFFNAESGVIIVLD